MITKTDPFLKSSESTRPRAYNADQVPTKAVRCMCLVTRMAGGTDRSAHDMVAPGETGPVIFPRLRRVEPCAIADTAFNNLGLPEVLKMLMMNSTCIALHGHTIIPTSQQRSCREHGGIASTIGLLL